MFNQEELQALKNILYYAGESISLEDEPLIDIVYDKICKLLLQ